MWSRSVKGGRALLKPAPIGSHRPPSAPSSRHRWRCWRLLVNDTNAGPTQSPTLDQNQTQIAPVRRLSPLLFRPEAQLAHEHAGEVASLVTLPPPLLHLAWPLRVRVRVRVCRDIAKQTPTLMNFTWTDAAGGPLPYIQRHQ